MTQYNNLKRILCLLLGIASLIMLTACGLPKAVKPTVAEQPAAEETPVVTASETTEQEAEIVEIQDGSESPAGDASIEKTEGAGEEISVDLKNSLPPPPDVDISSFMFRICNAYNAIGYASQPEEYGMIEGQGIDERIQLQAMDFLSAARQAGFDAYVSIAYRNWEYLDNKFREMLWVDSFDAVKAAQDFQGPGVNEHQTGLCMDLTDDPNRNSYYAQYNFDDAYMKDTGLYQWAVDHCAEYGFILRYPEGKEEYYGVACKHPAHFRYVGVEAATYIMENDLCLEEFLLLYENNDVVLPRELREKIMG